jgi:hypothetical protein
MTDWLMAGSEAAARAALAVGVVMLSVKLYGPDAPATELVNTRK